MAMFIDCFALADITVAGFRVRWRNTKGNQFVGQRQGISLLNTSLEGRYILNKMVGRKNQHYRVFFILLAGLL